MWEEDGESKRGKQSKREWKHVGRNGRKEKGLGKRRGKEGWGREKWVRKI